MPRPDALSRLYTRVQASDSNIARWFHNRPSDTLWIEAKLSGASIQELRFEQLQPFSDQEFNSIAKTLSNGASWHEIPGLISNTLKKMYPGLEQQWRLSGYQVEDGWLGSGLEGRRFFLVAKENSPIATDSVTDPLKLQARLLNQFQNNPDWFSSPCKPKSKAKCFIHSENKTLKAEVSQQVEKQSITLVKTGLESFEEIRQAMEQVPVDERQEYYKDLSDLLHTEAIAFLTQMVQDYPFIFNWSSWNFEALNSGKISIAGSEKTKSMKQSEHRGSISPLDLRKEVEASQKSVEELPAALWENPHIQLSVHILFSGGFIMKAIEK